MSEAVIKVEGLGKQYRLGQIGTGTISHDLNRWWHRIRGKDDPYLKIGEANDRSKKGDGSLVWALRDINFEVKKGEVLGVIGKNGAGKSTLLKILSQVTTPTVGQIKVKGRIASLLEVGTGFHPELTGRENIFLNGAILGMSKNEIKSKFDEIVAFSGIERYIDTPVKRYSSGMYVRLAFAVAAHLEPEILIVDEVLAVGDAEFQKKCLGKMKDVSGEGRTVLFVSHNMAAINNLCTRVLFLENGTIKLLGNNSEAVNYYLKGADNSNVFGTVPLTHPRNKYHKGVLEIKSVLPLGEDSESRDTFLYLEPMTLEVVIECMVDKDDVIIIMSLMNEEHGEITYSASNDPFNCKKVNLKKGINIARIEFFQNVLPGNYSIGVGVLDTKGYPFDYISDFGLIKIEKFGKNKEIYPWEKPLGLVNTKSNITIIN